MKSSQGSQADAYIADPAGCKSPGSSFPLPGRAARSSWWIYLLALSALSAGYALAHFAGPVWLRSGLVFNLIGGASVAALILGARRCARGRRLPWYLFALGQGLFVTSDVLAYNYERLFGSALPFRATPPPSRPKRFSLKPI